MKVILGVDPGFANFGFAGLGVDEANVRHVLHFGVIETAKSKDKSVLSTSDNLRRTHEIAHELEQAIDDVHTGGHLIVAIAAEAMNFGGPGQATTMAKVGMAWGALATVARARRIPISLSRPQEVHKYITGLKKSSKEQVQEQLLKRVPRHPCKFCIAPLNDVYAAIGLSRLEHPADALACAVHALETDQSIAARWAA